MHYTHAKHGCLTNKLAATNYNFASCLILLLLIFSITPPLLADNKKIYTVAYAQDSMANDWRAAQTRVFQELFAHHPGIRFVHTDGQGQIAKQIIDIENFIHQKVDILLTAPRDSIAAIPAIKKALTENIPVILVTRSIQTNDYTSLVAPDDYQIARQAARFMAKKMGGKGKILILKGVPTTTTAIARTEGFLDEIKNYPGITISGIKTGNWQRADTIHAMEEAMQQGIPFDGIYAESDSMASGARFALKKAGINPAELVTVGIDYTSEARQAIISGEQSASFVYPLSAEETVATALKIINGEPAPKRVTVNSQMVTAENVQEIMPIF